MYVHVMYVCHSLYMMILVFKIPWAFQISDHESCASRESRRHSPVGAGLASGGGTWASRSEGKKTYVWRWCNHACFFVVLVFAGDAGVWCVYVAEGAKQVAWTSASGRNQHTEA